MSANGGQRSYDLIVVGSGLAGLSGALLGATYGQVLVLTKGQLQDCNTSYAQGGIAVALGPTDQPALHYRDTLIAGDGLCDPAAVEVLVEEGPSRVRDLIRLGVPFDRVNGEIHLTREAAHSQPRILHAGGDATGARVETTLADLARANPRITIREGYHVFDLLWDGRRVHGVRCLDEARGRIETYDAGAVIFASGGAGQLYAHTTNPAVATGDGIAVAFRAGAAIADLEFMQFHPTALNLPDAPRFLISEAVRGEGGILRNADGERFMTRYDERAELAPRDIVARSIASEMARTGDRGIFLDVTHLGGEHLRRRFPNISRVCQEFGIDVGQDWIPVAPAAHYTMGGILTDRWGQSSLPGLYACGECACSGVHGANRLASNSLLEAAVFSARAVRHHFQGAAPDVPAATTDEPLLAPDRRSIPAPLRHAAAAPSGGPEVARLRADCWRLAGLSRCGEDLARLASLTGDWLTADPLMPSRAEIERASLILLGHLVATSALARDESRGAHYRSDFPERKPAWRRHSVLVAAERFPITLHADDPIGTLASRRRPSMTDPSVGEI